MGAEAGLGGMAALPVLVADQAVQPAIRPAALAEIIHQFGMTALGPAVSSARSSATSWLRGRRPRKRSATRRPSASKTSTRIGRSAWRSAIGVGCTMVRNRAGRQDRERQQIAAAQQVGQRRDAGVGPQVGALHVDVGDAGAAVLHHLVARADDVAAGAELHLGGPAQVGQQLGHVQRQAGEGRDLAVQGDRLLGPHPVQGDGARQGSARHGCSAPTAPRAHRAGARAARRSGRWARRWRHGCRTGWAGRRCRRCPAHTSPHRARRRRSHG